MSGTVYTVSFHPAEIVKKSFSWMKAYSKCNVQHVCLHSQTASEEGYSTCFWCANQIELLASMDAAASNRHTALPQISKKGPMVFEFKLN